MTKLSYSYNNSEENIAKAILRDAPISTKQSIEICSRLKYKTVEAAKKILQKAIEHETAIKFTRFTEGAGHKTGIGPGKFPVKTSEHFLKLLESAESNALDKGMGKNLKIIHLVSQKASSPYHHGRQRRIKMKRTHVEVVLKEVGIKKSTQKPKVEETKEIKQEQKSVEKPVEKKDAEVKIPKVKKVQKENTKSKQTEKKKEDEK
ncbi:MAG: 50S ribosomal protein L22 [archaeon]